MHIRILYIHTGSMSTCGVHTGLMSICGVHTGLMSTCGVHTGLMPTCRAHTGLIPAYVKTWMCTQDRVSFRSRVLTTGREPRVNMYTISTF